MSRYHLPIYMLLAVLPTFKAISQDDTGTIKILPIKLNADLYKIALNIKISSVQSARYKNIIVSDCRPDTQRIGVYIYGSKPITREIKIMSGLGATLRHSIENTLLSESATKELLIVVRHLWITNNLIGRGPTDKEKYKYGIKSMVEFKADVFVSDNEVWQPWLRIDTISYSPAEVHDWGERKFNQLMYWFNVRLSDPKSTMEKKKRYTYDTLKHIYAQEYSAPVFSWPKMKKGVYRSFEEFKNNSPSLFDFEIRKEKNFSMLYLKDANGASYYSHRLWGFCDGNFFYKNIAGNYFPLYRSGYSFYVYGSGQLEKRTIGIPLILPGIISGIIYGGDIQFDKGKVSVGGFRLYTINIWDGDIY